MAGFLAGEVTFPEVAGTFRVDRGSLPAGRVSIVVDTSVLPVDTWSGGVCMNEPTQSAADGWFAFRRFRGWQGPNGEDNDDDDHASPYLARLVDFGFIS